MIIYTVFIFLCNGAFCSQVICTIYDNGLCIYKVNFLYSIAILMYRNKFSTSNSAFLCLNFFPFNIILCLYYFLLEFSNAKVYESGVTGVLQREAREMHVVCL